MKLTEEEKRLQNQGDGPIPKWQLWGPYVAERAWGTVREDYSADGNPWAYFPFSKAHETAYRWGDDGIAGWCDRHQILLFAPAFWNTKDPILKERLFGLNSLEGNHGEDVKESYYYLDATPTHSYAKYLYKYPQEEFPYEKLLAENKKRSTLDPEYELLDTGIFDHNNYFDIFIEYAKASHDDTCIKIEIINRSDRPSSLHVLPQLWFRNQWSWTKAPFLPRIHATQQGLVANEEKMPPPRNLNYPYRIGNCFLYGPKAEALFTDNISQDPSQQNPYTKGAFHRYLIGKEAALRSKKAGTKAALHYLFEEIPSKGSRTLLLRLTHTEMQHPLKDVEEVIAKRKQEADAFYETIHPPKATQEEKQIQRQAIAGILWSMLIYNFDVHLWLKGDDPHHPPPDSRHNIRNVHWRHLNSMRALLIPDKWEYPWFAAWDHVFHCLSLALVDLSRAKEQLWLLLFEQFLHPNGEIPAYEWEFSDTNPPVQAWALLKMYFFEKKKKGEGDHVFLERCFHKLLINFAWWVNKVDSTGKNIFEGGFLGMDNISVYDRSSRAANGAKLQQSDGTGWMALFCLNLMRIALILAKTNKVYESLATKFFQHYVYIAHAMKKRGDRNYEMWSEKDGFFYDVLTYPDGRFEKFRLRSLVGLIPLFAVELLSKEDLSQFPEFAQNFQWFMRNRPDLVKDCIIPTKEGTFLLALMNANHLKRVLHYVWDQEEFRSPYGLRSLSKFHFEKPFVFDDKKITYEPRESVERIKGGNSNWRGPIWIQINYILIDALKKFSHALGKEFTISEKEPVHIETISNYFTNAIINIFRKDPKTNTRPLHGVEFRYAKDEFWDPGILFYEYYDPETGKGLGASHQTGWSALVANLISEFLYNFPK